MHLFPLNTSHLKEKDILISPYRCLKTSFPRLTVDTSALLGERRVEKRQNVDNHKNLILLRTNFIHRHGRRREELTLQKENLNFRSNVM